MVGKYIETLKQTSRESTLVASRMKVQRNSHSGKLSFRMSVVRGLCG